MLVSKKTALEFKSIEYHRRAADLLPCVGGLGREEITKVTKLSLKVKIPPSP
ncbi:hypothetical protein SHDE107825_09300 [Shewanella denitrificans]|jgi:hypothetical protein